MSGLNDAELKAFSELELNGWAEAAPSYESLVGVFTQQAIAPLLDAAQVGRDKTVLDLACGPGYAAGFASERGASATGIDFAPAMIAEATRRYPRVNFKQGDAEKLPFDDNSFDAVVCNFGLLHFARPETVIAETHRVLRPSGRCAFTVWAGPDQGPSYFSLLFGTFETHADMDVSLPPAPPIFRFGDYKEFHGIFADAGFANPEITPLRITWSPDTADELLEFVKKCAVRGRMLIEKQTAEVQDRIYGALREGTEQFRTDEGLKVPWPAVLGTAIKK